jgi:hypothetical protein
MSDPTDGSAITLQRVDRRGTNSFLIRHQIHPEEPRDLMITVYLGRDKQIVDKAYDIIRVDSSDSYIDLIEQSLIASLLLVNTPH